MTARPIVGALLAGVIASGGVAAAFATPASAAPAPVGPALMGLHISDPIRNWPTVPFGTVRLWDAVVTWRDLQPTATTWNFVGLDAQVEQYRATGKDMVMVLGQ
ncbi:MAG: hypothetical protein ABIM89_10900, partial [Mycobacteriales bacterium]